MVNLETLKQLFIENIYFQIGVHALILVIIMVSLQVTIDFLLRKRIKLLSRLKSIEERKLKTTRIEFLRKIISTIIILLTLTFVLLLVPGFKTFSISLLAGAGIAAIVIGFAAQKTLANIVSGISIAFFTPFRVGDRLKIGEEMGDVEDMNLRHTVIKTWDNRRIIIPNSVISEKEIVNLSIKEERVLSTINMGISYDSDIDKAKKIMVDLAKGHKDVIVPEIKEEDGTIDKKEPKVRVTDCGDFAVNLRLYFWVEKPGNAWKTGFDLIESIKKEFDKQGIEIPFPYRTIVYKKDLEERKADFVKKKK